MPSFLSLLPHLFPGVAGINVTTVPVCEPSSSFMFSEPERCSGKHDPQGARKAEKLQATVRQLHHWSDLGGYGEFSHIVSRLERASQCPGHGSHFLPEMKSHVCRLKELWRHTHTLAVPCRAPIKHVVSWQKVVNAAVITKCQGLLGMLSDNITLCPSLLEVVCPEAPLLSVPHTHPLWLL